MGRQFSNTEDFIKKANIVHYNKYNYDKVIYKHSKSKVIITCPEHGDFELSPNTHLSGRGCKKCMINTRYSKFITLSEKIHNKKYSYDKVQYVNKSTKILITCPEHGDFEQLPSSHLSGHGCAKCSHKQKSSSTENFIQKAKKVHGDKFTYEKVQYIRAHSKVIITCKKHGDFEQLAYGHLNGNGCIKCLREFIMNERLTHINKNV